MKKTIIYDIIGILGTGAAAYGLHLIYHPLLFISIGVVLIVYAIAGSKHAAQQKRNN